MKYFQNGALDSSAFLPSIDADLQRFFNKYFVDTDSDDDDVEFEGFTPEGIRGRPVYLINSCHNRHIASESDSHIIIADIGLPTGLTTIPSIGIAVRHTPAIMKDELVSRYGRVNRCRSLIENQVPNVLILSLSQRILLHVKVCILIIITT